MLLAKEIQQNNFIIIAYHMYNDMLANKQIKMTSFF